MSPKPPTPQQNKISPYKWVRQEFDHPSPEVNSVKKSLLNKLDEVARSKFVHEYIMVFIECSVFHWHISLRQTTRCKENTLY